MEIRAKDILNKHLKTMLKKTKQSYVTIEEMENTPEYNSALNAMEEYHQTKLKNLGVIGDVSCRLSFVGLTTLDIYKEPNGLEITIEDDATANTKYLSVDETKKLIKFLK